MNTATRVMDAQPISLRKVNWFSFGGYGIWLFILVLALFLSAFGIIYVKDLNRRLLIQEQLFDKEIRFANEQWGKLLLEQSTLARQARIHQLAVARLEMITPMSHQFESVKEAM